MRRFIFLFSLFITCIVQLQAMENIPVLLVENELCRVPDAHPVSSLIVRNLNALQAMCAFDSKSINHDSNKCIVQEMASNERRLSILLQTTDIDEKEAFEEIKKIIKRTHECHATLSSDDVQTVNVGYTLNNCCDMHTYFLASKVDLNHEPLQMQEEQHQAVEKVKSPEVVKPKFSLLGIIKSRTAIKVP